MDSAFADMAIAVGYSRDLLTVQHTGMIVVRRCCPLLPSFDRQRQLQRAPTAISIWRA